jgi:hypothetical protein
MALSPTLHTVPTLLGTSSQTSTKVMPRQCFTEQLSRNIGSTYHGLAPYAADSTRYVVAAQHYDQAQFVEQLNRIIGSTYHSLAPYPAYATRYVVAAQHLGPSPGSAFTEQLSKNIGLTHHGLAPHAADSTRFV